MPCYNVASTLDEALSSLMVQSLTDFEVVAVDDGSTDGTLVRLQDWAKRDQRIKVLTLPHQGIIASLNAGLHACKADIVTRMDADDRSIPTRLSKQVEMLADHPEIAVLGSLVKGFPEGQLGDEFRAYIDWLNTLITDEEIKSGMFIQSPMAHPGVSYRREWVYRAGGYQDHGWAEDYDLWLKLYLAGAKFGKVPDILLEWRDHPSRLTHTDDRYSLESNTRLKAHYLLLGPLSRCNEVIILGSGDIAMRLGKQLLHLGCASVTNEGATPGNNGQPSHWMSNLASENFRKRVHLDQHPAIIVAESDPERRACFSRYLASLQLLEMVDWWTVQ